MAAKVIKIAPGEVRVETENAGDFIVKRFFDEYHRTFYWGVYDADSGYFHTATRLQREAVCWCRDNDDPDEEEYA